MDAVTRKRRVHAAALYEQSGSSRLAALKLIRLINDQDSVVASYALRRKILSWSSSELPERTKAHAERICDQLKDELDGLSALEDTLKAILTHFPSFAKALVRKARLMSDKNPLVQCLAVMILTEWDVPMPLTSVEALAYLRTGVVRLVSRWQFELEYESRWEYGLDYQALLNSLVERDDRGIIPFLLGLLADETVKVGPHIDAIGRFGTPECIAALSTRFIQLCEEWSEWNDGFRACLTVALGKQNRTTDINSALRNLPLAGWKHSQQMIRSLAQYGDENTLEILEDFLEEDFLENVASPGPYSQDAKDFAYALCDAERSLRAILERCTTRASAECLGRIAKRKDYSLAWLNRGIGEDVYDVIVRSELQRGWANRPREKTEVFIRFDSQGVGIIPHTDIEELDNFLQGNIEDCEIHISQTREWSAPFPACYSVDAPLTMLS